MRASTAKFQPVSLEKGPQKASPVAGELLTADDRWEKEDVFIGRMLTDRLPAL